MGKFLNNIAKYYKIPIKAYKYFVTYQKGISKNHNNFVKMNYLAIT